MKKYWLSAPLFVLTTVLPLAAQKKSEQEIGAATFEMVEKTQGLYSSPELLSLVEEVGHQLESRLTLGYPLKYYLIDVTEPNAFATAGGYVFVTRGLLAIINSKDELAGVMAHELSHVSERHVTKKMTAGAIPAILQLPGNIIGMFGGREVGGLVNLPLAATSQFGMAAYSRSQEKKADEKGIELAQKAGYNPYGLAEVLERLTKYVEFLSGESQKKNLLIDHPVTEDRVAKLTKILVGKGIERSACPPGTDIQAIDGLIYGQNPAGGIIVESRFYQPDVDFTCSFPEKWSIQNAPQSVSAIAPDRSAMMVVGLDSASGTPRQAGENILDSIRSKVNILSQEEIVVNGIDAYRATLQSRSARYANQITEAMWIRIPTSKTLLRVVGIASSRTTDDHIISSFKSFRTLSDEDLSDVKVWTIALKQVHTLNDVTSQPPRGVDKEKWIALMQLINNVSDGQSIPEGRYLKVIEVAPLTKD